MMDWYGGGGPGWLGWVVLCLMMIGFWGALAVGLVALLRERDGRARSGDATSVLEARFARGEIDAEEFQQRRGLLADPR